MKGDFILNIFFGAWCTKPDIFSWIGRDVLVVSLFLRTLIATVCSLFGTSSLGSSSEKL